ncbi:iron ABC transporter substrate-binding protein [Methanococcus maripaludis]|uniref:Corrinoid ABC transporter substrate-binding protein n=1 Tax=Methanococcus maripaludis TaxID=39152 RepID=A0A2L1CCU7_METMI|nr:iron ABC transporter substrate-binding protein [Methanococcus maripaludis]AVB77040.1 corrinoid ABC transporter substrate-binding protein [Methanococcus maripaludis]MBA2863552.1 iron complex transport system substrate-binding protein [Methanococcus maripaludis]MBB6496443.1 iron complex transport system substrate-binding protein [Methanococcus maripaludis]
MKKIGVLSALISLMIALSFSGCVDNTAESSGEVAKTVEIVDMVGRTVEVPANIQRIVCSGPGCLRLVTYLQAQDKVVGVESIEQENISGRPYQLANMDFFQTLPMTGLGGGKEIGVGPYPEKVISAAPDVILITYMDADRADELQEQYGIPVVVLQYGDVKSFHDENFVGCLNLLGSLFQKEERAQEVIDFFADAENDLLTRTENISDEDKPSVYIGGLCNKGAHGIDSTSSNYAPFAALNANNVASSIGTEKSVFISKEQLLEWNPDIIFIDTGSYELIKEDYDKSSEYYESLGAFENGNVYTQFPYNYYTTNYGTALADAYYIGKIVYPEQFADIDIEEKADEIYEFLVGEAVYDKMAEGYCGFENIDFSSQ